MFALTAAKKLNKLVHIQQESFAEMNCASTKSQSLFMLSSYWLDCTILLQNLPLHNPNRKNRTFIPLPTTILSWTQSDSRVRYALSDNVQAAGTKSVALCSWQLYGPQQSLTVGGEVVNLHAKLWNAEQNSLIQVESPKTLRRKNPLLRWFVSLLITCATLHTARCSQILKEIFTFPPLFAVALAW